MQKIQEAGPVVGTVFNLAVKGKQTLPWPLTAAIDKTLFAKVKAATGGRLRMAVCGGTFGLLQPLMQLMATRWSFEPQYPVVSEYRDGSGHAGYVLFRAFFHHI